MLTAEQIERVADFRVERVDVPEWAEALNLPAEDAHVYVRTLTTEERDLFVSTCLDGASGRPRTDVRRITARLLAVTVCDAAGDLLFPTYEHGVAVFAKRSSEVCDRIFDAASKLNKLSAGDVEALAADFYGPTKNSSDSASPKR